jgi:hypothetical protein
LDAAIRKRLYDISATCGALCDVLCGEDEDCAHDAWDSAGAALLDVLDVHKRDGRGCCTECRESGPGYEAESVPYPCPTVRAIAEQLEIEL